MSNIPFVLKFLKLEIPVHVPAFDLGWLTPRFHYQGPFIFGLVGDLGHGMVWWVHALTRNWGDRAGSKVLLSRREHLSSVSRTHIASWTCSQHSSSDRDGVHKSPSTWGAVQSLCLPEERQAVFFNAVALAHFTMIQGMSRKSMPIAQTGLSGLFRKKEDTTRKTGEWELCEERKVGWLQNTQCGILKELVMA